MHNNTSNQLLHLNLTLVLSFTTSVISNLNCPNCGSMQVPFPLSTSPTCGHPMYKIRCAKGTLWFDAVNGSSYIISSISPRSQSLIIRPQTFIRDTCINTDFRSRGLWLNESLPFNISSENTIIKINCTTLAYISAMNCSSSSICYRHDITLQHSPEILQLITRRYIKETPEVAKRCGKTHICCSFTGGGSQNDHNIKITPEKCASFTSFVGLPLDNTLPVSKWPEPGVEIQWALPQELPCSSPSDCVRLKKSSCVTDVASRKKMCICQSPYQWDPIEGICSKPKCITKKCLKERRRKQMIKGLTYASATIIFVASLVVLVYMQLRRIKQKAREQLVRERQQILNSNNTSGRSAKLFIAKEIKVATKNFSKEAIIGSGGFGDVYKGQLPNGTLIAVKRAKYGNTKGIDQVLNEVRVLSQVNHRSLVRLLGCCVELEDPVLVYEYISNGTLFDKLHGSYDEKQVPLNWYQRLVIARQIAEGLGYLHFSAVPQIIHRDIKTSNILLTEKLDVKISDFGLSRLINVEETHMTTCAQGTLGYLDPQYYREMQLTDKSDVYSFGVVLLELLTSRKAIDFSREVEHVSLAGYVKKIAKTQKLIDVVDTFLKEEASKLELETMKAIGTLAVSCLDDQRHNRPSMREVADEIEYMLHLIEHKGPKQ